MGFRMPKSLAAMREVKAEGGWGVVCTEYCSIHPSSDELPLPSASLWDEEDVRAQALMVEKVHRHGALAGVELWHGGGTSANLYTREGAIGARSRPARGVLPVQCRAMDKRDIRDLRRWQVEAARRAQRAGFDIVYVYATHGYLLAQFLSPENQRSDEYGGSLQNRVRIVRELLEDTREAVGETCGGRTESPTPRRSARSWHCSGIFRISGISACTTTATRWAAPASPGRPPWRATSPG
jgi:dimethylamine/trimethylamine dehydrogenase